MCGVPRFVVLDQSVGTADGGAKVFCVARHLVQPPVGITIFSNDVRLNVVFAVPAPAGVAPGTGVGRRIRYARPGIVGGCQAVFQFVVDEIFEERERAPVSRVGVQTFDKAFEHGAQVSGGICPGVVGNLFVGGTVKIKTAMKVGQALSIVLIPENGPL